MDEQPWITFSPVGKYLTQNGKVIDNLTYAKNAKPSFITIIGRRCKVTLLEQFLGTTSIPVHQQVYLRTVPKARTGHRPVVVIDCGIPRVHQTADDAPRESNPWNITTLTSKIFSPFSSVVVYFVTDLGGPRSVAEWLASQSVSPAASDLPTLPRILLVMETTSDSFDETIAASRILSQLLDAMQLLKQYDDNIQMQRDVDRHFRDITVLGLKSSSSDHDRGKIFKKRLLALSDLSMQDRLDAAVQFNLSHFQALSNRAIESFSPSTETVLFAHLSRPRGFSIELFQPCLRDFLNQLPSQSWLWHFAAPLIASALLLSSYPPSAHSKPSRLGRALTMLTLQIFRQSFSLAYSLHPVRRPCQSIRQTKISDACS